jgi:hypothetical protein
VFSLRYGLNSYVLEEFRLKRVKGVNLWCPKERIVRMSSVRKSRTTYSIPFIYLIHLRSLFWYDLPTIFSESLSTGRFIIELGSSVSIVSGWLRSGRRSNPSRGERIFAVASVSRPALRPTQPPVQWVPGVLYAGLKRGRGVTLTTHPHLVPRLWMSRSYTSPLKRLHGV